MESGLSEKEGNWKQQRTWHNFKHCEWWLYCLSSNWTRACDRRYLLGTSRSSQSYLNLHIQRPELVWLKHFLLEYRSARRFWTVERPRRQDRWPRLHSCWGKRRRCNWGRWVDYQPTDDKAAHIIDEGKPQDEARGRQDKPNGGSYRGN